MSTDLILHRILKAPRARVWDCWTRADLIPHWFAPKPHSVTDCVVDLRAGGRFYTVMNVDGTLYPADGSILEVVPMEKLVFTDMLLADYLPVENPGLGFTATLTFKDHPDGTAYTALARHRTAAVADRHEAMGFTQGWSTVATQLEAFAATLGH